MNAEELLARSLDETLTSEEQALLDRSLAESAELRAMADDLHAIREAAALPAPAPSPRVKMMIQERVTYTAPVRRFRPPSWTLGLAALVLAGFLGFWSVRTPAVPTMGDVFDSLAREVARTQTEYHTAIAELEAAATERLVSMPPDVAHIYAANLHDLNRSIAQCEDMLENLDENHLQVYHALARAYTAKVDLLNRIMET